MRPERGRGSKKKGGPMAALFRLIRRNPAEDRSLSEPGLRKAEDRSAALELLGHRRQGRDDEQSEEHQAPLFDGRDSEERH